MHDHTTLRILIYDADKGKSVRLKDLFNDFGVKDVHIQNGYQPLVESVKDVEPDLVVLGDEFKESSLKTSVQNLKNSLEGGATRLLVCMKDDQRELLDSLFEEGLTAVIPYPPKQEGVKHALKTYMKSRQSRELVQLMRKSWFFDDFSVQELKELLQVTTPKTFQAGEGIIEHDEACDSFFVLLKGKVEAVIFEDGKPSFSVPIRAGHSFGEMGVLQHGIRGACCLAADECTVLEIKETVLHEPHDAMLVKIYRKLTDILVKRLGAMNDLLKGKRLVEPRDPCDKPIDAPVANEVTTEEVAKGEPGPVDTEPKEQGPGVIDISNMEFEDPGFKDDEPTIGEKPKNPFSVPTGTAETIDDSIASQEAYDVFHRKIKLRSDFILQKIPKTVYETIQNKLYGYWTGSKLAKFNPHTLWSPKLFTDGSFRLKKSLHIVVACADGEKAFKNAYLDLPLTHRCVGLSAAGCTGTYLPNEEAVVRYVEEVELKKAIQWDLEMPIDRIWNRVDCIEFLTHTKKDVRRNTLFLIFDTEEGKLTKVIRDAFPEHQLVTVVQGTGFDIEDRSTLFTQPEETLMEDGHLHMRKDWKGKGFYQGQTFFLPELSLFYENTDQLKDCGHIFGTIGALALMGPDYSGITWGSKGGAEGAVKAARAMYGMKGAQSAKELADAINWADE